MLIRQGDVVLRTVPAREPAGVAKEITLAIGEESGHSHVLTAAIEEIVGDSRFVTLRQDGQVRIEGMPWRHTAINVLAGTYEVIIEREYEPGAAPRNVAD